MARDDLSKLLSGEILEEDRELDLAELSRACQVSTDRLMDMIAEGIVEPVGREPARWRFRAVSVRRVRCAQRLRRDLGVNTAGAALALDLLEELERLRARLR